ncbi:MAG TPA: carboxypeptidase regulatory-like domain-containing protein [Myxococcales bacterium]|jgi:hypothetical protein
MQQPAHHPWPNCIGASCAAILLAACGSGRAPAAETKAAPIEQPSTAVTVTHSFDLAANMPSHLAIMFSMSWFGIPSTDPQGGGLDPSWGNWKWGGGCIATNNPASCSTSPTNTNERTVASRRRPLAGVYSSSGRDAESLKRVDLMLSHLRRSCDSGARFDAWAVQVDSLRDSSLHPTNPQSPAADLAYRALVSFFNEADNAGVTGVMPGDDATWYFHFGTSSNVQIGACNDTAGNPRSNCINALTGDIVDMVNVAAQHPSAYRINGKIALLLYTDSALMTSTEWSSVLQNARNAAGQDFYAIGATENSSYFNAFDALAPWVNLGQWTSTSGATVYDHATAWVTKEHSNLFAAVGNFPGRVVFGGVAPGFDDYTKDWGACSERVLPTPPDAARDANVLTAEFDFLKAKGVKGVVMETWDDWTEGSEFEPDVAAGTTTLIHLRQSLGNLYGEAADPTGDNTLSTRWTSYGQARNCAGGAAGTPPAVSLACGPPTGLGTITGTVTNLGNGGAISGATVSWTGGNTTSDVAGHYTLSNVTVGTVTITGVAAGFLSRSYDVTVTGNTTTTQDLQLSTSGKVVGNVTSGGVAVSNATVEAQGGQVATDATDTTDAAGHYDEGWLAIGTYTVTCSAPGLTTQTVTGVSVTTGGTTTVNCALAGATGTISGTVTNVGSGAAISGATVTWTGGSTTSDASGNYALTGLPAGTVTITANATGYLARSYDVTVTSGGNTTQPVQLSTSGKLVGNVTGNGAALANATVEATGGQIATDATDTTDSTGHYDEGWLAIGTYSVTCSAPGFPPQTIAGATVTTGGTTTVNCALSTTGSVTGKVTNVQTGGAISGATVSWSGGSTTTDASGNYTLAGVTAGSVTISGVATGYLARSYTVTVAGGGTATLNVQLSTSGKIVGNVTHAGAALSGVTVTATGGQIATTATATTDSTGHYDEQWQPIGTYTVTCAKSGFTTQTVSGVTVTTGGTTTVNCAL